MSEKKNSIFREYYSELPFVDRFSQNPEGAVDVLIPILHTNELWRHNLLTLYREIPVNRLLIGDGGCVDGSLQVLEEFPRVKILDQKSYKSLGFSIRKLMEAVETDWFIYAHSDVAFPPGWFDVMRSHQREYDWFGCPQQMTVMVDYRLNDPTRPYSGTQMGRRTAFQHEGLSRIDDDYVYRQEDWIFSKVALDAGFKEGKIEDTFHYHQLIQRPSPTGRQVESVSVGLKMTPQEEARTNDTQVKGIVKYLTPTPFLANSVVLHVNKMARAGVWSWAEFNAWMKNTNPSWCRPILRAKIRVRLSHLKKAFQELGKVFTG